MCDGGGDSFWIRKQQQQQQQSIDIFFFLSRPKKWIYLIYTYRHTKQKLDFKKKGGAFTGWVSFFLLSWIVWSLISLPWKPNQTFYLFYFLLMFNRKRKNKTKRWCRRLLFLFNSPFFLFPPNCCTLAARETWISKCFKFITPYYRFLFQILLSSIFTSLFLFSCKHSDFNFNCIFWYIQFEMCVFF